MPLKVGIDFGTSNSGVAVSDGSKVQLLPVDPKNITPEVVKTILYVTRDQKAFIGQEAVDLYYRQNIGRRRRFVKKRVGEIEYFGGDMFYVTDVFTLVDELMPGRLLQFLKTALRTSGYDGTIIFDHYYTVSDLVTLYLRDLKQRAETLLGETIHGVTLGRPVKFAKTPEQDRLSEERLRSAAYAAGFKEVDFELEPIAAALFYELTLQKPENVLIFDFGGGTLDITIMRLGDPGSRKVYANDGVDIAGSDFDRAIIKKRMLRHFGKGQVDHLHEISLLVDAVSDWMTLPDLGTPKARWQLTQAIADGHAPARLKTLETLIFNDMAFSFYNAVEQAKIQLSSQGAAVIQLSENNMALWELYTRRQFEKDIREYREQIEEVLLNTIAASGLELEQIDAVVKTGGSSNVPAFSQMLAGIFGTDRVKSSNAFSSVTAGLGLRAAGKSL